MTKPTPTMWDEAGNVTEVKAEAVRARVNTTDTKDRPVTCDGWAKGRRGCRHCHEYVTSG